MVFRKAEVTVGRFAEHVFDLFFNILLKILAQSRRNKASCIEELHILADDLLSEILFAGLFKKQGFVEVPTKYFKKWVLLRFHNSFVMLVK